MAEELIFLLVEACISAAESGGVAAAAEAASSAADLAVLGAANIGESAVSGLAAVAESAGGEAASTLATEAQAVYMGNVADVGQAVVEGAVGTAAMVGTIGGVVMQMKGGASGSKAQTTPTSKKTEMVYDPAKAPEPKPVLYDPQGGGNPRGFWTDRFRRQNSYQRRVDAGVKQKTAFKAELIALALALSRSVSPRTVRRSVSKKQKTHKYKKTHPSG